MRTGSQKERNLKKNELRTGPNMKWMDAGDPDDIPAEI